MNGTRYCLVCDAEIPKDKSIENHIERTHPLVCSLCSLNVPDENQMENHLETYHSGVHMR